MIERVRVAVVGAGNNTSALVQGIALHRQTGALVGVHRPVIDGLGVGDIDFVAAFARSAEKVGKDLSEAIFLPPNNFPRLDCALPRMDVPVTRALSTRPRWIGSRRRPHQHHVGRVGSRSAVAGTVRGGGVAAAR
ncbi:hypothetical protein GCM10027614_10200 [Micromonospora vulcania]